MSPKHYTDLKDLKYGWYKYMDHRQRSEPCPQDLRSHKFRLIHIEHCQGRFLESRRCWFQMVSGLHRMLDHNRIDNQVPHSSLRKSAFGWKITKTYLPSVTPQYPAKEQHSSEPQVPKPGPHWPLLLVPGVLPRVVLLLPASQVP
jgi:hypothetical protein